jgi:hypothetical protein
MFAGAATATSPYRYGVDEAVERFDRTTCQLSELLRFA